MDVGKRVSWVELYLDLVFVLAVGQIAHLIVAEPEMHSVWIALGLFFTLWWTWVGFAVLYNRHGADERRQRLLFLAAQRPGGRRGGRDRAGLRRRQHGVRAQPRRDAGRDRHRARAGGDEKPLRRQITRACVVSAVLFLVSIWVPEPFRYVLWAIAIFTESGAMLDEDRGAARRGKRDRDVRGAPAERPGRGAGPHHFAERFGLFLIILLGEVVVEAGQASVDGHVATRAGWSALVAAMVLAAALWWLYFDSAVELNLKVLELSGGSPTMARAIFAVGHMLPSFALLLTAAGVGCCWRRTRRGSPTGWPASAPASTSPARGRSRRQRAGSAGSCASLVLVATFLLARLAPVLWPHEYLWLLDRLGPAVRRADDPRQGPRRGAGPGALPRRRRAPRALAAQVPARESSARSSAGARSPRRHAMARSTLAWRSSASGR